MDAHKLEVPNLPYGWQWARRSPIYPSIHGTYKLTVSAEKTEGTFDKIYTTFWVDVKKDTYDDILEKFQSAVNEVALSCTAASRADTEESKIEYICELYNEINGDHV